MAVKKTDYNEQSIKSLKGAERVRKRPAVIFGSDDIIGCQHSFIVCHGLLSAGTESVAGKDVFAKDGGSG